MPRWILPVIAALLSIPMAANGDTPDGLAYFESKVRPVLVENCVGCHGPTKQKGGLRLDSRAALIKGGESGAALEIEKPETSLILEVLSHEGELRMPPKGKLPTEATEAITHWVKMGAPWTESAVLTAKEQEDVAKTHWSFQPVKKAVPPKASESIKPVDAFVRAKLDAYGLTPNKPADKRTLIRRVTYDLTGLPATFDEVEKYLADNSADSFAKMVDRVLESPRYGERWGRHWLDVARYADTKGYVFQEERRYPYSYTYRDWVINAFNTDMPYDQFVMRQIAADQLDTKDEGRSLAALGYLTVGRRFLNNQQDIIDDRIDVVGRGFLGLTISCARCHDHKFDPIPTDDYYSLYGVFASCNEPAEGPAIPGNVPEALTKEFESKVKDQEAKVEARKVKLRTEIVDDLKAKLPQYLEAGVELSFAERGDKRDETARNLGLRVETFRWIFPHWKNVIEQQKEHPSFLVWKAIAAIPADMFAFKLEDTLKSLKSPDQRIVDALLKDKPAESLKEAAKRYGAVLAADQALFEMLSIPESEAMRVYNRKDRDSLTALTAELAKIKATHPGSPPRAMILADNPNPTEPKVFVRGNPGRQGKQVPRRFLQVLSTGERKPFSQGSGRKELAQAIGAKDNPLTARVMVNRVWAWHFGRGLVRTPSDFGIRGDAPTHPELLDYLADQFMASGWSIKSLHRLIMNSQSYKQSSDASPTLIEADPQNLLITRFNLQRIDFEGLRDALLMSAGSLDVGSVGGRPVDIFEQPFSTRRTVYGFIDRQNLPGTLRSFDFASPDASTPSRFVTTVPQQALFLMNSPFVLEQATKAAHADESGDPADRIQRIYRKLFARPATAHEIKMGLKFLDIQDKLPALPGPVWINGYGKFDKAGTKVTDFQPFPHWTGSTWQASAKLPDDTYGYINLSKDGGHTGNAKYPCAIRRWVAPCDGVVSIDGLLQHGESNGDGVCCRVVSSRAGELGTWVIRNGQIPTRLRQVTIKTGDLIDFVVDPIENESFDSFTWAPKVRLTSSLPDGLNVSLWDAKSDFQGPKPLGIDPWTAYAQVLLLTNEFAFVD